MLNKSNSLKSFDTGLSIIRDNSFDKKLPNYFNRSNGNNLYFEKSFQTMKTAKNQRLEQERSTQKNLNATSYLTVSTSNQRNPLNQILMSSNERKNIQHLIDSAKKYGKNPGSKQKIQSTAKLPKSNSQQRFTLKSQSKNKLAQKSQDKNRMGLSDSSVTQNLTLNKLRSAVHHVKTLQSELNRSQSRSRSKKGISCTLYEKSLEKKINQSSIKEAKKLVTIKTKFEKTEKEHGPENDACQKEIKKILLKKKTKQDPTLNNTNCFHSVVLDKSRGKHNRASTSKPKPKNIPPTQPKNTSFIQLNKSLCAIKQTCRQHKFPSSSKSIPKPKSAQKRATPPHEPTLKPIQSFKEEASSVKKIIMNDRIKANLDKVHDKYKFILNYLNDFQIIGKLNGFEIAGIEECKWILLIIDDVYEMIKHAETTKLKGMEHSRNYQLRTQTNDQSDIK